MKSRSGFTLIELMVVIVVLSIIVGITVVGYNAQIKAAHDNKSEVSAVSLASALDKHYSETGSYPITCDHSAHAVIGCDKIGDTYKSGMTAPPTITPNMTQAEIQAVLPTLDDTFSHPRNPEGSPINHTVSNVIQTDSYFLLSMDMMPGASSGGIIIPDPGDGGGGGGGDCSRGQICIPGGPIDTYNDGIQLASSLSPAVLAATTVTDSSVTFANPTGGSDIQCSFQLTGKNSAGAQDTRPHQYVIGFVNEESNAWKFYIQDPRSDLNIVNWNSASNTACNAESISTLK